ncbi:hypothetical protein MCAV_08110 [[Mycoplasma] cavipharyngis]|uniref:hypothetical protein n=1 Tax=[Mycoplasma] cavipharyngis TaxID=92757 RepID=UPI0037046793
MILKNKGSILELKNSKIIFTNNLFDLWLQIKINNDNAIIISPLTNLKDLYNLKNKSPLYNYIQPYLTDHLVNEPFLMKLENQLNEKFGPIFNYNLNSAKLLNDLLEIENQHLNIDLLRKYLKELVPYLKGVPIVIMGFDQYFIDLLKESNHYNQLFCLTTNLSKFNLTKSYAELLVFDVNQKSFLEVKEFDLLKNFFENQLGKYLSDEEMLNYLTSFNIKDILEKF